MHYTAHPLQNPEGFISPNVCPCSPLHQTCSPSRSPSCRYVLYQMTQHTVVKQTETLGGIYKAAFLKIFDLLEDSGWALKPEGKEGGAQ